MDFAERRQLARQARDEGKAVYHRNRASAYRNDAAAFRYRGNEKAAAKLDRRAEQDEATASRLTE